MDTKDPYRTAADAFDSGIDPDVVRVREREQTRRLRIEKQAEWREKHGMDLLGGLAVVTVLLAGIGACGYAYHDCKVHPSAPAACHDSFDIRMSSNSAFDCPPGAVLETRPQTGNVGYVEVTCRCQAPTDAGVADAR